MPKGNPKPSAGFKKGQSGNPAGRKPGDPITQEFRNINNKDLISGLTKLCHVTKESLQEIYHAPETPMFEVIIARIIADAAKGVATAQNILLERLCGKVKDRVDFADVTEREKISQMPLPELLSLVKQATEEKNVENPK